MDTCREMQFIDISQPHLAPSLDAQTRVYINLRLRESYRAYLRDAWHSFRQGHCVNLI